MKHFSYPVFALVCASLVWGSSANATLQAAPTASKTAPVAPAKATVTTHLVPTRSWALSIPEQAPHWFYPSHRSQAMVNPYLTPARVLKHPQPEQEGQVVLWEGRILKQSTYQERSQLLLGTPAGNIAVSYLRPARNLEFDRSGYRVAIKGYLHFQNGQFKGLSGLSCILLEPPLKFSYQRWLNGRPHSWQNFIAWRILFHNPDMDYSQVKTIAHTFVQKCEQRHLDPSLLAGLIQIESAWDTDAVSLSGAQGLGQLMPKTTVGLKVENALDPLQNLEGCSKMVDNLLNTWKEGSNPYASVLASYNAGPTLVKKLNGTVPAYAETTNYVYFIGYVRRDMLDIIGKTPMLLPSFGGRPAVQ